MDTGATDRADVTPTSRPRALGVTALLGDWLNTEHGTAGGILRLSLSDKAGQLWIRAFGADDSGPRDWGEVETGVYGMDQSSSAAWSFLATYDFGFLRTTISAYHKLGILVVTTYNTFFDGSGRNDYWTREFFHRQEKRS